MRIHPDPLRLRPIPADRQFDRAAAAVPGAWRTLPGTLPQAASWAEPNDTAVRLDDGRVLLAGGEDGRRTALFASMVYDVPTGVGTPIAGRMQTPRRLHTVTKLRDGKVLVTGGVTGAAATPARGINSVELFDPAVGGGAWRPVASMNEPRFSHSATLLTDGSVLVAGGCSARSADTDRALRSAEIYNPATNTWTTVKPMTDIRFGHNAIALTGGKVLVIGGVITIGRGQYAALGYCEIFTPGATPDKGTWAPTASLRTPRKGHQATVLKDGSVLVTGGDVITRSYSSIIDPYSLKSCERFRLDANGVGTWTADADMPWGVSQHRAVALPNSGKVLVIGGTDSGVFDVGYSDTILYTPGAAGAAGTWTIAANMAVGRWAMAAVGLPDDQVFVAGGISRSGAAAPVFGESALTSTAEVYTP
ncbi:Kelch-like protein 17 [Nocardia colli]|uniref:Kelch-like protein 17 n=1 Tax=Nocardia colli TaxID=2545717 RepID=A0A5N0DNZ0_9NOCA|nr:kelch repeat-containing protein [Nocardia colli]KAA8877391.1 Kelch-like protein 17 [Nocardia colli]